MSAIKVVGAQAYLAGLSVVHESNECLTHLAQVHHPVVLRSWKGLPDLIAFDTWAQIADRSAGNLIRRGRNDIVLIDHGHLAGSVSWTPELLQPDTDPRHPFLALWGGEVPSVINQGIMRAAEGHTECFLRAEGDLKFLTSTLLDASGDRIAILDFLEKRAEGSPDRMRRILRLLV